MRYLKTFESFGKSAFHGYLMEPEDMRVPNCNTEWTPDSKEDIGCPDFTDENPIPDEDEILAKEFLEEGVEFLIAYSRGGAIFIQSIAEGSPLPEEVYLVAPAWLRGWTTEELRGDEIKGARGVIIHGGKDDKVPLRHSAILSKMSGLPLYVFPECNHVNILKHKDDVSGGIRVKNPEELVEILPDWGKGTSTPEEVERQYKISLGSK